MCYSTNISASTWYTEKQLVTVVVIPDLSTAFDTVDHDFVQEKQLEEQENGRACLINKN